MLDTIFQGIFDADTAAVTSLSDFLICIASALVIGLILALCFMYRSRCSHGFVATLALLPAVVSVVIMMVNGNVGAGVAVAGAFSLVRFRSAPGSAQEIGAIFLAMGTGLVVGMGYIGYAFLVTILLGLVSMLYARLDLGTRKNSRRYKTLHITIPEDLDYTGVFDELFQTYTSECELIRVKTANMGSLFHLTYHITLRDPDQEKELIDKLRCRNGNLEISISSQEATVAEL